MLRLGGNSLFLSGNELQLSRGEPISDTAKVLSSMLDVIVLRTDDQEKLNIFSQNSSVPLINGLSDLYHPCQIMADLMTFREIMGDEQLEKVCWIGDGNNVCHSYMEAADLLGFELSIFCPSGYEPDSGILESTKNAVSLTKDKDTALKNADIVTTDVWTSMNSSSQSDKKEKIFKDFFVSPQDMKKAKEHAIFLHCLPAHRGEEITEDMLEDPSAKVWIQAENRMHVQEAILEFLLLD
jgi:ornithine carbamoyltransferase